MARQPSSQVTEDGTQRKRTRSYNAGPEDLFVRAKRPRLDGTSIRDAHVKAPRTLDGPLTALCDHSGGPNASPALYVVSGTEARRYDLDPRRPKASRKAYSSKVPLTCAAVSASGELFSVGDSQGKVRLIKVDAMKVLRTNSANSKKGMSTDKGLTVSSLAFSVNVGNLIIIAMTIEGRGVLRVWRYETDEMDIQGFPVHDDVISSISVRPSTGEAVNDDMILTTSRDGSSKLIRLAMNDQGRARLSVVQNLPLGISEATESSVSATDTAPCAKGVWFGDGVKFMVASGNAACLFQTVDGEASEKSFAKRLGRIIPHTKAISDLAVDPMGRFAISCAGDEVKMVNVVDYRDVMLGCPDESFEDCPSIGSFLWYKNVTGKKNMGSSPELSCLSLIGGQFLAYGGSGSLEGKKRAHLLEVLQSPAGTLANLPVSAELAQALEVNDFWQSGSLSDEGATNLTSRRQKSITFSPVNRLLNRSAFRSALDMVLGKPEEAARVVEILIHRGALDATLDCSTNLKKKDGTVVSELDDARFVGLLGILSRDIDKNPTNCSVYFEALMTLFSMNENALKTTGSQAIHDAMRRALAVMQQTQGGLTLSKRILASASSN